MKKSRPTRAPRKLRRNPLARALATPKFRPRVTKVEGAYRRRPKHVPAPGDEV